MTISPEKTLLKRLTHVSTGVLAFFAFCSAEAGVRGYPAAEKAGGENRIQQASVPAEEDLSAEDETPAQPPSKGERVLRKLIADRVARELGEAPAAGRENVDDEQHAVAIVESESDASEWNRPKMTASSSLEPEQALRLAKLVCSFMPRSSYCFVLPTGSMKPLFGDKVILLLESAPFETLHVGDIVTYRHPRMKTFVVHRLVAEDCDRFRSKGDANQYADDVCVTRHNYRQRVFGIIYSK